MTEAISNVRRSAGPACHRATDFMPIATKVPSAVSHCSTHHPANSAVNINHRSFNHPPKGVKHEHRHSASTWSVGDVLEAPGSRCSGAQWAQTVQSKVPVGPSAEASGLQPIGTRADGEAPPQAAGQGRVRS